MVNTGKEFKVNDNRLKAVASNLRRLQGGSGTDGEIVIADSLLHILRGNVLHDYFVRDISRTGHKVSASPQMTAPKLLRQLPVLRQQLSRGFPFDPADKLAH
jgi:hypothetical protein